MFKNYARLVGITLAASAMLPALVVLCSPADAAADWPLSRKLLDVAVLGPASLVGAVVLVGLFRKSLPLLEKRSQEQVEVLDGIPPAQLARAILASAALSLFLELVLIRW